ncbi:MAG: EamA family transporter [Pseudomonadota bacterium]
MAAQRLPLPPRDLLLVGIVVLAWGSNFSAMRLALDALPPLLFVALRFAILLPLLALFPRRPAPWAALAGVALLINCGQFALLFTAISVGLSAGMASLLIQLQAPLTIVLTAAFYAEAVSRRQALGLAVALAGLAWIALTETDAVPGLGLALVVLAALSWAGGNLILRRLPGIPMLAVFAWASLLAWPPMLALSLLLEGPEALAAIPAMGARAWAAVIYVAVVSTVIGYALWGTLLARHRAVKITPFALLIPVVGLLVAAWVLGERPGAAELIGGAVILAGVAVCVAPQRADVATRLEK